MRTLTFILVLALSLSVYAKTEAILNVEGHPKAEKQTRNLAATSTVNDLSALMDQLNKLNSKPAAKFFKEEDIGFSGNAGTLTRSPQKKSAVPTKATAVPPR